MDDGLPVATEGNHPCVSVLVFISWFLICITFPFSLFFCLVMVNEHKGAVIFRIGRILRGGAKGPGLFFIIPSTDDYRVPELRTVAFDVPPKEVLYKDSVTVTVDAVVYCRVFNPVMAISNAEDFAHSTKLLASSVLRNVLGTKILFEMLSEREFISRMMQSALDVATDPWGVKVERVEMKDLRIPVQMQRAMATEAEAVREGRAKVILAEGEQQASRALKDAAEVISESPVALQLRYLQTLVTIAGERNSTIVFSLPPELMTSMLSKTRRRSLSP